MSRFHFPGGKALLDPTGVVGMEVKRDNSRDGFISDGNNAWPENIAQARVQWPEVSPEDFERFGKRGWRHRETGIEFLAETGAPLLSIGTDANRNIVAFMVIPDPGRLVFLSPASAPRGTYVHHGTYYGGRIENGQIIKEGS